MDRARSAVFNFCKCSNLRNCRNFRGFCFLDPRDRGATQTLLINKLLKRNLVPNRFFSRLNVISWKRSNCRDAVESSCFPPEVLDGTFCRDMVTNVFAEHFVLFVVHLSQLLTFAPVLSGINFKNVTSKNRTFHDGLWRPDGSPLFEQFFNLVSKCVYSETFPGKP